MIYVLPISRGPRAHLALPLQDERGLWKFHRIERSSASQYRSVKLPVSANTSGIAAACNDGVLCVNIPKIVTAPQTDSRRRITIG